ncbi:MAG: LamG domain-containing protein [Candidatus Poribacteria bacterium]
MIYRLFLCLSIGLCSLIITQAVFSAQEELVLYLPFNSDIKDMSGNNFKVELKGKENWVAGKFGKAMEFDGMTHLEIPDTQPETFDGIPFLTIGIWVKQDNHHDNGIVVKLLSGAAWPCSYNLETWSDQLAYFDVGSDAGKYATSKYPLKEWFYLVGVFDSNKGEDRIYVNGTLGSTNPRSEKVVPDGNYPIYIGCVTQGSYFFRGALDELVIYKRALTEDEIKQNMNEGINFAVNKTGKLSTTWATIKSQ